MTIEEMRKEMRREVVPEEVVPQNVINCLIDEDAEPPKPDAFSFLMRLRALGIGSDDFLNLLKGCDAPEGVINKIEQNPSMNLQGLIMTLENSELTPEDYTRMLLTARQVWERTLTMRLEKSEKLSQEIPDDEEDESVKVYGEPDSDAQTETETEYSEDEADEYFDEDMLEMSFTAILDKINAETLDTAHYEEEAEDLAEQETEDGEPQPDNAEEPAEEAYDGEAQSSEAESASDNTELSFTAAFDKIKSEKQQELASEAGQSESATDRTEDVPAEARVRVTEDRLRETFSGFSIISDSDDDETEPDEAPEKPEPPRTAKQAKNSASKTDENKSSKHGYHKGAIIGAAVGAAALIGAGFFIGSRLGGNEAKKLHYAADNYEIFEKIYYAHSNDTPGGSAVGMEEDHRAIFGDLLISAEDGAKGQSGFSTGAWIYSVSEEAISADMIGNGTVTTLGELLPPENSRFVAAFDENGELYALFSGKQSGFMKIADGKEQYTVRQDGVLTDFAFAGGEIRLGTVYTPSFGYTFSVDDDDVYLPKLGADEPAPIGADKVIVSDTDGYSYGVSAGYSADNGQVTDVCAVIGDPVSASADGRFALNGDNGVLVDSNGDKITAHQTEKLVSAAFGENGCAITENGDPENIKLLDNEFNTVSVLTGITEDINVMHFDGSFLTIGCANSVYRVDCSDIGNPDPLRLRTLNGIITGQSALTCEVSGTSLIITRYDLKNGAAEKIGEYSKELTAAQLASVKLGGVKTAVIDGAKSGVAYSYFDGVSVISEYVVFGDGEQPKTVSVFDDRTGFTAAFKNGGTVNAVCAEGVKAL